MKALICPSLGPAENLLVTEVEAPRPGDGEALVAIAYAGLNFFDTLIIEGKYQVKPTPPFSPAGEFSGRVVALGAGAQGFEVGDRVMGACAYGGRRGADRYPHEPAGEDPRRSRPRQGRGPFGHLRHIHARAQTAGRDEGRRDPFRARRLGRRRPRGGGDRQGDGRSRRSQAHRRRKSSPSPAAMARLRRSTPQAMTCARASRRSRPRGSTSCTIQLGALLIELALRRSPGKGGFW